MNEENHTSICPACNGTGYEQLDLHPYPGFPCKKCRSAPPPVTKLETSMVRWEHEDNLPKMTDEDFELLYAASRVDIVRLYPFVEDSKGNRIWIIKPSP